jgi:hypothetical protein
MGMNNTIYSTLSDCDLFIRGDTIEVWYAKEIQPRSVDAFASIADLSKMHVLLGTIGGLSCGIENTKNEMDILNMLFDALQGENYSSNGEARHIVRKCGTDHTSMSVGDVIRFKHGNIYVCDIIGWQICH